MYNPQESFESRAFTQFYAAFLECALWASTDENDVPLERNYQQYHIATITRATLKLECMDFYTANYDNLYAHGSMEQGGYDFYLTRCGHGTGFWDLGTGEVGQRLTAAAKVYGSVDFYVGDDGDLYAYGYESLPLC